MTYFDCVVVGSWMFAIGWFLGAIYVQNQDGKMESPRLMEEPETWSDSEAWDLPTVPSPTAAD